MGEASGLQHSGEVGAALGEAKPQEDHLQENRGLQRRDQLNVGEKNPSLSTLRSLSSAPACHSPNPLS